MLTMRATPKMSEKPIANRAYTPPLTRPVTRMSWSKPALLSGHLERLHAFHLRRPERHLLAVLPLHGDAGGLADRPDEIVALVEGGDGAGSDVLALLDMGDDLVGVGRAFLLDRVLQDHDRVVGRRRVGRRFFEARAVGTHERHRLRRVLDLGVRIERRHELRLAGSGLPELFLLPLDVDPPRHRLHVAFAHLTPDRDADRAG